MMNSFGSDGIRSRPWDSFLIPYHYTRFPGEMQEDGKSFQSAKKAVAKTNLVLVVYGIHLSLCANDCRNTRA
ncbi:MAG: hypothetical protein II557_06195, partial [Clostridia bacterium]|nr:hypothetical protein [Clostridia bacterium]